MFNTGTWMEFKGKQFDDFLVVEEVRRSLMPSISNEIVKNRNRRSEIRPTFINVKVRLISDTELNFAELKRTLAGMLHSEKPEKLVLYDDPTRYDMAIVDGNTDLDRLWTTGTTVVTFVNAEGLSYSMDKKTPVLNGQGTVVSSATWKTFPVLKVSFTATKVGYKITNVTTGKHFELKNITFNSGNQLVINCKDRIVTLNGNPIKDKVTLASDYIYLQSGNNVLNPTNETTVEFNEVWL